MLPWLPTKSLMRFKCVCKSWSSTITGDSSFLEVHRNMRRNVNYSHLLLKVVDHSTGYYHSPPHWPKSVYNFSPWHTIHTGKLCIRSSPPRIQASVHVYNTMINNLGRSSIVLPEQICLKEDDARLSLVAREEGVNII